MWICRYFLYFIVCSFFGWLFECIYTIFVTGEWENRGFLYGPICPIYGFGAVSMMGLMHFLRLFGLGEDRISWWQVFLIAFFGSAILEYATHYFLEKRFNAYWWDYSNLPLNINGRICLPASLLFGICGVGVVWKLAPFLNSLAFSVNPIWIEAAGMLTLMIGTIDATLTVEALTDFARRVEAIENAMNFHMETFVESVAEKKELTSQWMADGKDILYQKTVENMVEHMGRSYRRALSRVKGFRPIPPAMPQIRQKAGQTAAHTFEIMEHALGIIKNRVKLPGKKTKE